MRRCRVCTPLSLIGRTWESRGALRSNSGGSSQAWLSLQGLSCRHRDQLYLIVLVCQIKSCSHLQDLFSILPGVGGIFSVFHNSDFTCVLYITAYLYFSYLNHCSFYLSKSKDYRQIMQTYIYRAACLSICVCALIVYVDRLTLYSSSMKWTSLIWQRYA